MEHYEYLKARNSDCLPYCKREESKVIIVQIRKRKNLTCDNAKNQEQRLQNSVLSPQSKPFDNKKSYCRSNPFFSPNRLSQPLSQIHNNSHPIIPTLTPTEKKVVKEKVRIEVQLELKKLKNRMISKIAKMNKIGVMPKKANEIRGISLMSVESSFMY